MTIVRHDHVQKRQILTASFNGTCYGTRLRAPPEPRTGRQFQLSFEAVVAGRAAIAPLLSVRLFAMCLKGIFEGVFLWLITRRPVLSNWARTWTTPSMTAPIMASSRWPNTVRWS